MRSISVSCALVLASLLAAPARADLRAVVVAGGPEGFSTEPVQARLGEPVELRVALVDGRTVLSDVPVRIGRRSRVTGPLPDGIEVEWIRVEPEREHLRTPSPNPGIATFSNAVLTGPRHGAWIGLDVLEYRELALAGTGVTIDGPVARLVAAHPTDARHDRHGGAGTAWIAAIVRLPDGTVLASPGASSIDRHGLTREVMRVSFRSGDDYLGWLSTYFNVPDVFGSVAPQVERYTGADCADVLVAGMRRSGAELPYVSVAGLERVADARTGALSLLDGRVIDPAEPTRVVRWGADVAPGDLVTIDYAGPGDGAVLPRDWDHIGALVADDGDGVLDGDDVLRHMGNLGLTDEPLSAQGPIRLRLHRFR